MTPALFIVAAVLAGVPRRDPAPAVPARATPAPSAVLPAVAGFGVGLLLVVLAGPVTGVLLGVPVGAGAAWAAARVVRSSSASPASAPVPLALDLLAAAVRAGATTPDALRALDDGGADPRWAATTAVTSRVAGLLALGAAPAEAWSVAPDTPAWRTVRAAATRSADSGVRLAATFDALAGDLRAGRRAAGLAAAQRTGVLSLLPLGLCFLPAFVCLGVVPVIAGIASAVLSR